MFEKGELTWLIGSLEHCNVKPKCFSEAIHVGSIQCSLAIECSHPTCALTCFDDELYSPRLKPGMSSCDSFLKRFLSKGAFMLLAHLILDGKSSLMRHLHHCPGRQCQLGEAFTTFDP